MNLTLWYVVLVCHQYDVCKKNCWQCVCWCVWCSSKSGPRVFRELCPVGYLVVGEGPSDSL